MKLRRKQMGFGLIEVILSVAIFGLVAAGGVMMTIGSLRLNRLGDEQFGASFLASEGVDAVQSIRKQGWTTPLLATDCTGGCGLTQSGGVWAFSGSSNVIGRFTRVVTVTQSMRDGSGNIVDSGGTLDANTYKVSSVVTWNRGTPPITNTVTVINYLTNFGKSIPVSGGLLVYGDGTTTPKYRTYDTSANTFGAQTGTVVSSSGATFVVKTSPTKTEAIAGFVTAAGVLNIQCFDGSAWTQEWTATVGRRNYQKI